MERKDGKKDCFKSVCRYWVVPFIKHILFKTSTDNDPIDDYET